MGFGNGKQNNNVYIIVRESFHRVANFSCDKLTSVEPVKATLRTSLCKHRASPVIGPYPGKTFTTPSGNPASLDSAANAKTFFNYNLHCFCSSHVKPIQ